MEFHSEGGLELLSRFRETARSINLDNILFSTGIDNRSTIEIVGASSTGKTLLLCQFIAKCLLPAQYEGMKLDGCDVYAIAIDTLGHLRMEKIVELMVSMIRSAYQVADVQPSDEVINDIINKYLKNLTVISCCDNIQLKLTLHTLEDELLSNEKIALLAVDNILAHYWEERKENALSMDCYAKDLLRIIQTQMSKFHAVTVYTRWDGPVPKYESHPKCTNLLNGTGVNYRLQLSKSTIVPGFMCRVQSTDVKQICYTISDSGIKWI